MFKRSQGYGMFNLFSNKIIQSFIVILIVILIGVYCNETGYQRAILEIQNETTEKVQEATKKALEKAQIESRKVIKFQKKVFDKEIARLKMIRELETEIIEVIEDVEKVNVETNCNIVNPDFIKLLNQTIDTVNKSS